MSGDVVISVFITYQFWCQMHIFLLILFIIIYIGQNELRETSHLDLKLMKFDREHSNLIWLECVPFNFCGLAFDCENHLKEVTFSFSTWLKGEKGVFGTSHFILHVLQVVLESLVYLLILRSIFAIFLCVGYCQWLSPLVSPLFVANFELILCFNLNFVSPSYCPWLWDL